MSQITPKKPIDCPSSKRWVLNLDYLNDILELPNLPLQQLLIKRESFVEELVMSVKNKAVSLTQTKAIELKYKDRSFWEALYDRR